MSSAKTLRRVWIGQVSALVLNIGILVFDIITRGGFIVLVPIACIIGLATAIRVHTGTIRRREYLDRPRPDYASIAAMEREVYGETFKHEGAPKPVRVVSGPHGHSAARQAETCDLCGIPGAAKVGGLCPRCYRLHLKYDEHRSNLRWERPS